MAHLAKKVPDPWHNANSARPDEPINFCHRSELSVVITSLLKNQTAARIKNTLIIGKLTEESFAFEANVIRRTHYLHIIFLRFCTPAMYVRSPEIVTSQIIRQKQLPHVTKLPLCRTNSEQGQLRAFWKISRSSRSIDWFSWLHCFKQYNFNKLQQVITQLDPRSQ